MTKDQFDIRYSFDPERDKLGGGAFGIVYKSYDHVLNLYKAIKVADVKKINGKEFSLRTEFENVKNLAPHTNIANYEAVYQFKTKYGVIDHAIMQYYEEGTLKDLIQSTTLTDTQKFSLIRGILMGLDHLHKANIIHRDLKSGNILIAKDQNGEFIPKISDFGLSKLIDSQEDDSISNSLQGGSIYYTAPEQLMGLKIMQNADIWSLGILIFEIFNGFRPFEDTSSSLSPDLKRHTTLLRVFKGNISPLIDECPYPFKDIVLLCLQIDPYKRIKSVEKIFQYLDYPELISNNYKESETNEDTIIFGYNENDENNFRSVFKTFLANFGIADSINTTSENSVSDEMKVSERIDFINNQELELKKLKDNAQNYKEEGERLFQEGFYYESLEKYLLAQEIFPSQDMGIKINELKILIKKSETQITFTAQSIQNEDFNNALIHINEALLVFPQNKNANFLKAEILEKLKFKQKNETYKKYLKSGDEFFKDNSWEKSLVEYEKAKQIFPERVDVVAKISIVKANIKTAENEKIIASLIHNGDNFFEKDDFEKSLEFYNKGLEIDPDNINLKTKIKLASEKIQVVKNYTKFHKIKDNADNLFHLKNYEAALNGYKQALGFCPNEKECLEQISQIKILIKSRESEGLLQDKKLEFENLIKKSDDAIKNNHYDRAIEYLHQALNLFPNSEIAILKIDHATRLQDEAEIKEFAKLKHLNVLEQFDGYIEKANISLAKNDFGSAISFFKQAAELQQLNQTQKEILDQTIKLQIESQIQIDVEKLIKEGKEYFKNKNFKKAINTFKKALTLSNNQNKTAAQYIENIQNKLNQEKIALEITSLKADAEMEVLQGNYDQAIRIFQGLSKKHPAEKGLIHRLEELQAHKVEKQNKEKEKQNKLVFDTLIKETNQCVQEKKYKYALKLVNKALLLFPENKSALDLKTHIEQLLKEEKSRIIPWYVHFSNFASANQKYLFSGISLLAILGATYNIITKPKSGKLSGQPEIFKNEDGLYGCKLDGAELISAKFDTIYLDVSSGLNGVRNDSLFSIKRDGTLLFISYSKPETPARLTKELIESITDIDDLYSLINTFPNNPLTPYINKRIKILGEQKETQKYLEILNIPNLETNWKEKLAALEAFIKEYPRSKFLKEIRAEMTKIIDLRAKNLSEADLFYEAKNQNSIELLNKYIENYPNGKYATDAKKLLAKKQEEDDHNAWNLAKENALDNNITEPLTKYLSQFSMHAQEAKTLIADIKRSIVEKLEKEEKIIQEHSAQWKMIKEKANLQDVIKFINDYPNSIFINEAKDLKAKLEKFVDIPEDVRNIEENMINVSGGSFTLGCDNENDCDDDAKPSVTVNIKNVSISKYEVTQKEYQAIMGINPSFFNDCPSCPVENVSFDDAMEYIRKLNALPGNPYKYRLPTEAEWEYFALANKNTLYSGGDDIDNYAIYGTRVGTAKVNSKKPNAFGLYGMTGNVAEWCSDYYLKDAYVKYQGKKVTEINASKKRVVRGGSFRDNARNAKVKKRNYLPENEKTDWIGFRLVKELK